MVPDTLASWNDGAALEAIVAFVARVTDQESRDYVEPAERIAVFDNDGTLWTEKPMQIQLDFTVRRFAQLARADPALRDRQPYKAAISDRRAHEAAPSGPEPTTAGFPLGHHMTRRREP